MIFGLDIGGANTKICDEKGEFCRIFYNPLWKNKSLEKPLKEIPKGVELAVVMTGELSDIFPTKFEGIKWIFGEIKKRFPSAKFFGLDANFHESPSPLLDASNWLASAKFVSLEFSDVIFADVGSTTTDLIPIVHGEIKAHLRDLERIMNSELLYFGVVRTPVSSVLPFFEFKGRKIRVASEYFASLGDVYIVLGELKEEEYLCETPDGRGKKRKDSLRRLSRMFCADLEEIEEEIILDFCRRVREAQIAEIEEAIRYLANLHNLSSVFGCGIGEFLLIEACERIDLEFISASKIYGKQISNLFPAFAVANLMKKEGNSQSI